MNCLPLFPPQIKEDVSCKSCPLLNFILEIQSKTICGYFPFTRDDFIKKPKPLIKWAFPTVIRCNPLSFGKKKIQVTFARYTEVLVKKGKSSPQFNILLELHKYNYY